jgi:hypothetical protein
MTSDPNIPDVEAILARSYSITMSPRSRTLVDRRVTDAMATETARRTPRRRAGFRRLIVLAVGLLVVSGLVASVGAATHIIRMEWGSLPEQQRTPAQINAEIAVAMKTTPVPPGYTFPPLSVSEGSGVYGSYSGQSMVEFNAACGWYGDWTTAFAQGDQARVARDRAMMGEILTWKTIADPFLADDSVRNLFRSLNASADASDPKPIEEFRRNNCSTP